jgi:hypothetical protein
MTMRTAVDSSLAVAATLVGEAEALGEAEEALVLVMMWSPETPKGPDEGPLAAELMGVLWSAAADPVVCSVTLDAKS